MKALFAFILMAPFLSYAKTEITETKVPVKEGYEKLDMNQFKDIQRPNKGAGSGVQFSTVCTSKSGVQYKPEDSGFETCLREADADKAQGLKSGATPNMGVKIGN